VSGLSITFVRVIIVSIAGDEQANLAPIIIYFCIAVGFNFFTVALNARFCRSKIYKEKIAAFLPKTKS
jgi:hypothetical protein